MYQEYNHNPRKVKASDCVIRAFGFALDQTWDETFLALINIAYKIKAIPNEKKVYTKYAEQLGLTKCKVELVNGRKPTVASFAETHKEGTYILSVANHMVAVKDGKYYDIWDCGNKSVYMYWQVWKK